MAKKKSEFPDAFAIATLEDWCIKSKNKCFVLSKDKDINLCVNSNFKILPIEKYLDVTIRRIANNKVQINRIKIATDLFNNNKQNLEKEVEDRLYEELENKSIYYQHNYWEIEKVDVNYVSVSLGDFQISSVTGYNIILDAIANCNISIDLEFGDYKKSFDSVDVQHPDEEISKYIKIPVSFEVDIPLAGDEFMEIRLDEINNKRDLEI